jgi:predicted nuclease with TOPRIM domain
MIRAAKRELRRELDETHHALREALSDAKSMRGNQRKFADQIARLKTMLANHNQMKENLLRVNWERDVLKDKLDELGIDAVAEIRRRTAEIGLEPTEDR